jgi:hypothetical protein
MRQLHHYRFLLLLGLGSLSLTSCGNAFLKLTAGKAPQGPESFKQDEDSVFTNLKERCGFTLAEGAPQINLSLKSLPVVVKGKQKDIEYIVTAEVNADRLPTGEMRQAIKILSITATSNGVPMTDAAINKVIRPIAEEQILKNNGRSSGTSPVVSELIKLTKEEGSYKGVFCSVGLSTGFTSESGSETGATIYSAPIPTALNPTAAFATFEAELGAGRTFSTIVKVLKAKKDWPKVGTEVPVTVSVKKISSTLKDLAGLPAGMVVPSTTADLAYEIVNTTSGGVSLASIGLPKRMVFFIDTKKKNLVAVVNEQDKPVSGKTAFPPIVLLPTE